MFQTTNQFSSIATTNWWFVPPIYGKIGAGGSSCLTHISLSGPPIWPIDFQEYGCKQSETLSMHWFEGSTIYRIFHVLFAYRQECNRVHVSHFPFNQPPLTTPRGSRTRLWTPSVCAQRKCRLHLGGVGRPEKMTSKLVASWGFQQQIVKIYENKWKSWEYHGNSMRR